MNDGQRRQLEASRKRICSQLRAQHETMHILGMCVWRGALSRDCEMLVEEQAEKKWKNSYLYKRYFHL